MLRVNYLHLFLVHLAELFASRVNKLVLVCSLHKGHAVFAQRVDRVNHVEFALCLERPLHPIDSNEGASPPDTCRAVHHDRRGFDGRPRIHGGVHFFQHVYNVVDVNFFVFLRHAVVGPRVVPVMLAHFRLPTAVRKLVRRFDKAGALLGGGAFNCNWTVGYRTANRVRPLAKRRRRQRRRHELLDAVYAL